MRDRCALAETWACLLTVLLQNPLERTFPALWRQGVLVLDNMVNDSSKRIFLIYAVEAEDSRFKEGMRDSFCAQ